MQGSGIMKKLYFLMGLLAFGCQKDELGFTPEVPVPETENWVVHQIDSGAHYSNQNTFKLFNGDVLAFQFSLDSSAVYQTLNPANQESWNKLYGFADCNSHHHTNSMRLTWRYTAGVGIELASYYYRAGVRSWQIIDTIQPFDTLSAVLSVTDSNYVLQVADKQVVSSRACAQRAVGYYLYPYFGGTEPAPQTVRVYIKED
jgi:hypothetical protein